MLGCAQHEQAVEHGGGAGREHNGDNTGNAVIKHGVQAVGAREKVCYNETRQAGGDQNLVLGAPLLDARVVKPDRGIRRGAGFAR